MTHTTHETPGGGVLLTGAKVMALLDCDRNALYEMRRAGTLPFVQLTPRRFRYPEAGVLALMAGRPSTPAADDGRARRGRGKRAAA